MRQPIAPSVEATNRYQRTAIALYWKGWLRFLGVVAQEGYQLAVATLTERSVMASGAPSELPISHIYPVIHLESDLREMSHFLKTKPLMQRHAFSVWKCDPRDGSMDAAFPDCLK